MPGRQKLETIWEKEAVKNLEISKYVYNKIGCPILIFSTVAMVSV
jgi:hypothetical protein